VQLAPAATLPRTIGLGKVAGLVPLADAGEGQAALPVLFTVMT